MALPKYDLFNNNNNNNNNSIHHHHHHHYQSSLFSFTKCSIKTCKGTILRTGTIGSAEQDTTVAATLSNNGGLATGITTVTETWNHHSPLTEPITMQCSAIVWNVVVSDVVICSTPLRVVAMANCTTRLVHDMLATKPMTRREIPVARQIRLGRKEINCCSTPKCAARLGMCCSHDDIPTKRQKDAKTNSWK